TRSDRDWSSDVCSSDLMAVADQTVIAFTIKTAPRPRWVRVAIGLLIGVPLLTLVTWWARRRSVARLRLPFYYWVEGQPTWRVITDRKSTRLNSSHDQTS